MLTLFRGARLLGVSLLVPFFVGCAATDDSASADSDIVVGVDQLIDHVTVFEDRLEFDATAEGALTAASLLDKLDMQTEPVYFIGGRAKSALAADGSIKDGARNPNGYLRRGVSWTRGQDGRIVVKTEKADMAEAVEELKKTGYLELSTATISPRDNDTNGVDTDSGWGNIDKKWNIPIGPTSPIDLAGKELWQKQLLTGGNARVSLKQGKITVNPTADISLLVKRFIPKAAEAVVSSDINGDLEFQISADGAFDDLKEGTLYEKSWGTEVRGLPLSLDLKVSYACEVASSGKSVATAGVTAQGHLRMGASLNGTDFRGIFDKPTYSFGKLGPQLDSHANVQGICKVITRMDLKVFDASGPTSTVDLWTRLDADASNAQLGAEGVATLTAGVDATVGGSLRPFGFRLADINMDPYHQEKQLFTGTISVGAIQ